jgi:hypothetical protein
MLARIAGWKSRSMVNLQTRDLDSSEAMLGSILACLDLALRLSFDNYR